jgi:hypothetical protein
MPIIDTPAGTLEVTNAILSASEFRATQKISVSNSAPTKNFSVGDKFHVSTTDADAVNITGNLVAQKLKIGNLLVSPTFDLAAVSNVGNTTSNTLQFANATTSFVASSNVEIGGNITLTSNAQVKVGSNVLAEYTGPHGREPKEMPLKKFPEIAFEEGKFDRNDSTNTYTQAGYTVTSSSALRSVYTPWRVFDGYLSGNDGWVSSRVYNGSSPGEAQSGLGATQFSGRYGEYIDLKLPYGIKVDNFIIKTRPIQSGSGAWMPEDSPGAGYLYGSNNGATWTEIKAFSGLTYGGVSTNGGTQERVQVGSTVAYTYLRLQATHRVGQNGSDDYLAIGALEYYGYEEPAPPGDLSLDTTLKSTFNSVRSNNYVMYFDGKDPAAGNVPKYLPSGSVKSITPNNVVFDATNNCWTLDGSTESNVTTGSLEFEGDVPHTVSTWINASNLDANATTQQLFSIGSGYDKAFLKVDDTQIAANTWHNVTYAYQGEGGSKVTYVDGRKVEEAQVEDTFGEYPPFSMTDYETGGYRVSASSELPNATSYKAYQAFDDIVTGNNALWLSNNFYGTNGVYTGAESTTVSGTAYSGEWLQIELPYKLKVSYVAIQPQNDALARSPLNGVIAGSNDGTTWNLLDSFTGITTTSSPAWSATVPVNFTLTSSTAYKYFRLVITATQSTTTYYVSIQNVQLYGHKEGDLTRFPEPTRVLKYPHIAMTGYAQRGYVASSSTIEDALYAPWKVFNGNSNTGTGNGSDSWISKSDAFTSGTSNSNYGFDFGSGQVNGPWLRLDLPHKLKMDHVDVYRRDGGGYDQYPKSGYIYGYDGSTWHLLKTFTNITQPSVLNATTIPIDSNIPVSSIVMLITERYDGTTTTNQFVIIKQLEYYGTQENTETPLIVGGPFAGKVANFRVYDQYLGDERIQEIYDAQKDEFGHKKSSMTFYKGRIGVGTTEPEGALTVIDEPHALAKFPARAVSADVSYVEGDGQIKLSAADGSGYQAFDGLTSTSWTATPTRNTRLSEEVDFGAWLKIQTPESVSLKKAEIESNPYWQQLGTRIDGVQANARLGASMALSDDGTRLVAGAWNDAGTNNSGAVYVYDWNGSAWSQVGSVIGHHTVSGSRNGWSVSISGDGNTVAVGSRVDSPGADSGSVTSFTLVGATWTLKGDVISTGVIGDLTGYSLSRMSTDGNLVAFCDLSHDKQSSETDLGGVSGNTHNNAGRVRVFKYENGAWSQRGSSLIGELADDQAGRDVQMSEDGKYLIFGTSNTSKVYIFEWNGTDYIKRGSTITGVAGDIFGRSTDISKDGSVIAIGYYGADEAEGALAENSGLVQMYKWNGTNAYTLTSTLTSNDTDASDQFGTAVYLSSDGKRLVVGADSDDAGGTTSGIVCTFESTDGSKWLRREPHGSIGTTAPAGYNIGRETAVYISRDGSTIAIGEYGSSTGGTTSGSFRVFNMPSNIKSIWGSNDDVNWTKITTGNETFRGNDRLEFKNLDNPNYYKYHAIVADAFTRLKDVKLFRDPEPRVEYPPRWGLDPHQELGCS